MGATWVTAAPQRKTATGSPAGRFFTIRLHQVARVLGGGLVAARIHQQEGEGQIHGPAGDGGRLALDAQALDQIGLGDGDAAGEAQAGRHLVARRRSARRCA
jgi:hypothetical protein